MGQLRIFHTADWHLGKNFGNFDRTDDYRLFLNDFLGLVVERRPDVLLITGDIFDTSMPSSAAQALWYDFIGRLAKTDVALTVVTAGNHDSQRFLEAPSPLLKSMRCVIASDTPEEEAVIFEKDGRPALGIAAVPYLREADVRSGSLDYTDEDRAALFEKGVLNRYTRVREVLTEKARGADIPMIAMGHLFVTGSKMKPDGSGDAREKRESVHVGTLRNVTVDAFGHDWDYIALGHIHNSQEVKNTEPMYYSGSPLALSFGHKLYKHIVIEVNIDEEKTLSVLKHPVKQPRRFVSLSGTFDELLEGIRAAGAEKDEREALVEAKLTSNEVIDNLVGRLQEAGEKAGVRVMIVRNERAVRELLKNEEVGFDLTQLTPTEVFKTVLRDRFETDEAVEEKWREFGPLFTEIEEEVRREAAPESDAQSVLKAEEK